MERLSASSKTGKRSQFSLTELFRELRSPASKQ